jgi:transposase
VAAPDQAALPPTYSPNDNPIERVWWHLHEQVTRNLRCAHVEELVKLTLAWLDERGANHFRSLRSYLVAFPSWKTVRCVLR